MDCPTDNRCFPLERSARPPDLRRRRCLRPRGYPAACCHGIRDRPTAPRSPWQNKRTERLIGSFRRECPNHIVDFGEAHILSPLAAYASYHNDDRTRLALAEDAPLRRAVQRFGKIAVRLILADCINIVEFSSRTDESSACIPRRFRTTLATKFRPQAPRDTAGSTSPR